MSKLTRGNVLATIKKLKKMPRPKAFVSAPAVQAICGQKTTNKPNKVADLKAVMQRRRALAAESRGSVAVYMATDEFKLLDDEFNAFITDYISKKDK